MKRTLLILVILATLLANLSADETADRIRRRAAEHLQALSQVPLSVHVDTSPYSRQPRLFDIAMFTWDDDAPYLFINGVQLTMAEANMEIDTVRNAATDEAIYTTYTYTMEMMVVDPEVGPRDLFWLDGFIHQSPGLYSTPAFRYISHEDVIEAGTLENNKNIVSGFSGGLGMGFGGIALACLLTIPFIDDYQGTLFVAGAVSAGIGGLGVYICNRINNNLNRQLGEVFERMAAAANGQGSK